RVGNPSDAPTARDVVAGWLALPEGYAPTPSLAGARSRQLSLSKIVPYDFVEPSSTRVGNPSDAPTARDVVAGGWRSQRDMRLLHPCSARVRASYRCSKSFHTILSNPRRRGSGIPQTRQPRATSSRGVGAPRGIRTLVAALRGLCPRPLDDGSGVKRARVRWWAPIEGAVLYGALFFAQAACAIEPNKSFRFRPSLLRRCCSPSESLRARRTSDFARQHLPERPQGALPA